MSVTDLIIQHYKDHKKQHVDVPEWKTPDGKPLRIYWNLMTAQESESFAKSASQADVDVFCRFALDEKGTKMFTAEDKPKLRVSADANIIRRVVLLMLGPARTLTEMVDDAEKN